MYLVRGRFRRGGEERRRVRRERRGKRGRSGEKDETRDKEKEEVRKEKKWGGLQILQDLEPRN